MVPVMGGQGCRKPKGRVKKRGDWKYEKNQLWWARNVWRWERHVALDAVFSGKGTVMFAARRKGNCSAKSAGDQGGQTSLKKKGDVEGQGTSIEDGNDVKKVGTQSVHGSKEAVASIEEGEGGHMSGRVQRSRNKLCP